MALWLYNVGGAVKLDDDSIYVHKYTNWGDKYPYDKEIVLKHAFIVSCRFHRADVAEWLLSLIQHMDTETFSEAFSEACGVHILAPNYIDPGLNG